MRRPTATRVYAKTPITQLTPLERRQELSNFNEVFENLVDTLCDSARFGASESYDNKYRHCRELMQEAYPPLKPFLISYLEFLPDDAEAGLKLSGKRLDAFETLVAPIDLQEFFRMDDGNMISRLNRTREALNLYGEHLRQLAEQRA